MAAAAADAAALAAAKADLEVTFEGKGSEEDPSELGCKDLKESGCVRNCQKLGRGSKPFPVP